MGVFSAQSPDTAPNPYPTPGATLTGKNGYCTKVAANGYSINTGFLIDPTKLNDVVNLGVKFARMPISAFSDDLSFVYGPGSYRWTDMDSAECAMKAHSIAPYIEIDAGPVMYGGAVTMNNYQSAADYATFCSAIATHQKATFGADVYTIPGNEMNTSGLIPGGNAGVAAYTSACYKAIKAVQPSSTVYAFELNMDGQAGSTAFVAAEYALGCGKGTCYDGLAAHLSLRYPIPPAGTPCYPNPGGDYSMQCITDLQNAAHAPTMKMLVNESGFFVPNSVPDEATKAIAITQAWTAFSNDPYIVGATYNNVDECAAVAGGYFENGCLIDTSGNILPGYTALQTLAHSYFI